MAEPPREAWRTHDDNSVKTNYSNCKMPKFFQFLLFLCGLISPFQSLLAEDFKNLKGARGFLELKAECEYLAPDEALAMARQGTLLNNYLYGEDGHPGTNFIFTTFNIPPGSESPEFLQVSPLARNFSKFVVPSVAGKLLDRLRAADPAQRLNLEDLKRIIKEDPGFQARVKHAEEERERGLEALHEYKSESARSLNSLVEQLSSLKIRYAKIKKKKRTELAPKHFPEGEKNCSDELKRSKYDVLNKEIQEICDHLPEGKENRDQQAAIEDKIIHLRLELK